MQWGEQAYFAASGANKGSALQALVAEVAAHGAVGDVGHPTRLAEIHETVLEILLRERIAAVLDRGDGGVRERRLELPGVHVREADVPDLPFRFERDERPQRFPEIHRGVHGMELVEGDDFRAQGREALLARRAQPFGAPVHGPLPARPAQPALGGDEHLVAPPEARQGVVYQALVMADVAIVEAIDVGGVDEIPAGIDEGLDDPERLFRSPGARRWRAAWPRGRWPSPAARCDRSRVAWQIPPLAGTLNRARGTVNRPLSNRAARRR